MARKMNALTVKQVQHDDRYRQMLAGTVLVDVTFHRFGTKKATTLDGVIVDGKDADDGAFAMSKRLVNSTAAKQINTLFNQTKRALQLRAVPSFDREGTYRVSVAAVKEVERVLLDTEARLPDLRALFIADYEHQKVTMREQQGSKFREQDYPSAEVAASRYGIDWDWMAVGVPDALGAVDTLIHERAVKRAEDKARDAYEQVEQVLRAGLLAVLEKLTAQLQTTTAKGVPRKYQSKALAKFNEFLATFPLRNIIADGVSAEVVAQAQAVLNGYDADDLNLDALRQPVIEKMTQLAESLRPYVTDAGRAIALPDDDE